MTAETPQLELKTAGSGDLELVHASKNGDMAAFEQLVQRYDRRLFRMAQHITRNKEDSQDAVQDAFLKAYQHLDQFREDSLFSTWLIRIAVNESLAKLRKQRTIKEVSLDEDFPAMEAMPRMEVTDWRPNPEQQYRASELRDILAKALGELRPILRAVFVLRDMEGLTTTQTAEVLNLTDSAVKSRLLRGRLQLRERLSKYFGNRRGSIPAQLRAIRNDNEGLKLHRPNAMGFAV
jgi:RNA polymerase sigma-70 factor, ECF subfamily